MTATRRKGATRMADIPAETLAKLECGEIASATLAESLALDQKTLFRTIFPEVFAAAPDRIEAACSLGILKRTDQFGRIVLDLLGADGIAFCQEHASDMVRGWACFAIGARTDLALPQRLLAIRALADDAHFGVREWASIATRPHLAADIGSAVALLEPWTSETSERLRRFSCEALRPRGVWCPHIPALKRQPEQALPILSALKADPSAYVQDSVANWLNDAGKDRADWVAALCQSWLDGSASPHTRRICARAMRNLR